MNVIVYAIPVFVVLMAAELAIGLAAGRNVYRLNDAVGSLAAGILSQISGVFMLALSVGIYVIVYNHLALFALPAGDWRVWVGALVAYDFCYYWNHRVDHEVGLFWAAHVVHHQSDCFNLSTALRQSSTGSLLGWIFYLPLAIVGHPAGRFRRRRPDRPPVPVLDPHRARGQARLVRPCLRLALQPSRASRDQRPLSRQELRRNPHPLGSSVRHVRAGGREGGVRRSRGPRRLRPDRGEPRLLRDHGRPLPAGDRLAGQAAGVVRAAGLGSGQFEARGTCSRRSISRRSAPTTRPPAGRRRSSCSSRSSP